jgi:hypothetical protein
MQGRAGPSQRNGDITKGDDGRWLPSTADDLLSSTQKLSLPGEEPEAQNGCLSKVDKLERGKVT